MKAVINAVKFIDIQYIYCQTIYLTTLQHC